MQMALKSEHDLAAAGPIASKPSSPDIDIVNANFIRLFSVLKCGKHYRERIKLKVVFVVDLNVLHVRQKGVDTAEIATQLGHLRFGHSMTLRYMPHSPDYLAKSSAALEKLLKEVFAPVSSPKRKKAA